MNGAGQTLLRDEIEDDAADAVAAGRGADALLGFLGAVAFLAGIEARAEQHAGSPQHHHRGQPAAIADAAGGGDRHPAGREIDDRRHDIDAWCATRRGRPPRCPARSECRRRHRAPAAPSSSFCTWQISSAPDDLIRGANGLGSPNDSMIARGRASSAMSSSAGCFARLQVMKPMPKGSETSASLAVSCFEPRSIAVAAAENAEPAGSADGRGETRARDDVHRRRAGSDAGCPDGRSTAWRSACPFPAIWTATLGRTIIL